MTGKQSNSGRQGRVLPFQPRAPAAGNDNSRPQAGPPSDTSGVGDLDRFERNGEPPDDYRHRMRMNAAVFVLCSLLVLAGVWLAVTIAQMRKDQDCVLSGRRGCTPVDVPVRSRWSACFSSARPRGPARGRRSQARWRRPE